jgi:hypothetical protein
MSDLAETDASHVEQQPAREPMLDDQCGTWRPEQVERARKEQEREEKQHQLDLRNGGGAGDVRTDEHKQQDQDADRDHGALEGAHNRQFTSIL